MIVTRKIWTSQPPAGTGLTNALKPVVCFNFAEGIAPRNLGTLPRSIWDATTATIVPSKLGLSAASGSARIGYGGARLLDGFSPANSSGWCMLHFTHGAYVSGGSSVNVLAVYGEVDTTAGWYATANSSNVLTVNCANTALTGPTLLSGSTYTIVWGRDGAGNCALFVNGRQVASGTGATAADSALSRELFLLGDSGTSRWYQGKIALFAAGSENILAFGRSLSANPWQIFKPEERRIWTSVAAGALTHTASGVLAGPGALLAGTSAHFILHAASGALSGQGAVIVGSAVHPHITSGALTGPGAQIIGSAVHPHIASGILAGPGAILDGTATRSVGGLFETTGIIVGQGAVVEGNAVHLTLHTTSGALTGPGTVVSGTATHLTLHTTSGALVGQGALITGVAAGPTGAAPVLYLDLLTGNVLLLKQL